jgi:hypothetical protein
MARQKTRLHVQPSAKHTHLTLLPPRDQDDDPTPLLHTLARVAISVAARRRARRDHTTGADSPAQGGPEEEQ